MLGAAWLTGLALLANTPIFGAQAAATCGAKTFKNPVLYEDFPDNDISVGPDGAYYFSASNFHYSPGAPILRSYDLVDWEFVGHSIPRLNFGDGYDLPATGERSYRGGTWASTLRYRKSNGLWYWIGCTNFWITWVFTAPKPEGPWTQKANYGGGVCFYDNGLLIDDDDTMYVVYTYDGGKQVNVTQLAPDGLSTVRTEKVLVPGQVGAESVEGNRMYKINGLYYILNDHPGSTAYVWKSTSPWGPYEGQPLADSVPGPVPGGGAPHQGSLVQAPSGDWYFMSFTWAYPSGRMPVLAPIKFQPSGFPTLVTNISTSPPSWGVSYPLPAPKKPLNYPWTRTHSFTSVSALPVSFEWNHNPDTSKFSLSSSRGLILNTASVTTDLYQARNTLTHRVHGEFPSATAELDISGMADGDRAGLAAFRDRSAYIGLHKTGDTVSVVALFNATIDEWSGTTLDLGSVKGSVDLPQGTGKVSLRVKMDARASGDHKASFEYSLDGKTWTGLGGVFELYTGWAFFLGYRFAVFNYATKALGGNVAVLSFGTA
ncbi:hydrolase-like protein [Staphylotrichum tortipilum]|uniref:Hydrolase-like protein n=1 Tax=Staphylotrichum tortipilum TaxID=2831512 RepID=A0AAN6MFL1_9PEZI|nr:hydrolase-like protein [Staphylotrichum longicolle]